MTSISKIKTGRVGLVTGAGQGIGKAYAMRLAMEGASVVAVDLNEHPGLEEELLAAGAEAALALQADVSEEDQVADVAKETLGRLGRCDILINNVGITPRQPLEEITLEQWRKVMAVNVDSNFLTCRAFVPQMKERRYGRIVNVSSDTFGLVIDHFSHYIASKAAVIGLTRALATDLGEWGITVNAIAPGLTKTPNTENMHPDGKLFDMLANAQAVKRSAVPEDMVGAVSFLTSEDCAFVTGQTIIVNGGLLRSL